MPTSYLPQRLVHAHLPSSSSTTIHEPQIPVITPRQFPTTDETEEPLSPEHAISTLLEPSTGILARITHNGYLLQLRNFSLTISANSSPLRSTIKVAFPEKLRPMGEGCIIPYPEDGRVYILLLTENDIVYRLKLSMVIQGGGVELSTKGMDDWCEEWEVPEETLVACGGVGAWKVIDEDTIVLGGGDGGIVRLTRAGKWGRGASWSASHQRPASKFRLPSIFSRSASSDELVISTALHHQHSGSALYTLSRDYKLRSWNSVTGSLLRTLDIRSSFPSSQDLVVRGAHTSTSSNDTFLLPDITDVPLVRVVPHPSSASRYSHLLVIFLATPLSTVSAGIFVVYRVTSGSTNPDLVHAGHRECSTQSAGSNIRGFQITTPTSVDHAGTGWRLAVTWEKRGLIQGETICMDDIFQFATTYESTTSSAFLHDWHAVTTDHEVVEKMDTAYFDRLISLDPPIPTDPHNNVDIAQTFVQHLFYPERFSIEDLETALTDYLSQPGRQLDTQLSAPSPTLSSRFESVVGCDLEMSIDAQTGAPVIDAFREAMKRDWLSIWARIRDLDKHSRYPLASTEVDGHVLVHTRAGLSAYITEDACGVVDRSGESEDGQVIIELPESSFSNAYPRLDAESRRSAVTISTAGSYIVERLDGQESSDGSSTVLEDLMDHIDLTLASSETEPIESRCEALWDDMIEPYFGEEDQLALRRVISNTSSERDALSHTLDLLASDHTAIDDNMDTSSDRIFSGSGNALLTSSIASTIQGQYALARKILLVALYHLTDSGADGNGDDGEEFEEVVSIVNRVFCIYHRYRVLRWLCEQTGEEGRIRTKASKTPKHRNEGEENALQKRNGSSTQDGLEGDGTDPSYSLLHSLLATQGTSTPTSGFSLLYDASQAYLCKIDLVDSELVEIEPRDQDVVLAYSVLKDGHADTARRMTELYSLSSGTSYIRGRALVETGAFDESVDYLKQAASGCRDGSLACILPITSEANGESDFYAHVSSLYGDAGYDGPAIYFGQLALRSSKSTPSKALYTRIFLSNIALGNYEDAYSVLTATSSEELKGEFLGQLISVMCENNEVGRLNALGFIGFQQRVEELLSFKARNSDPLRYPNYYKVLYSWHISRGDYRSAGEIMYKQGRRFAEGSRSKVTAFDLSAMQARSYLAAINALSLVDKKNAWIALAASTRPTRVAKRRRVSSYIPAEEWSKDNRAIDIVTLADMKEEYALVLAQLKLAGQVDDFHLHGSSTTPDEVVGLLVQRGSFDLALSTASSLNVDMTSLFQSLARRCVELSRLSDIASDLSSASFLHASPLTSRLRGSPSALALRYLQISLERHDSQKTNFKYRQIVAETLFEINTDKKSGWEMPSWLVHMEMERDAEAWIGRAVRYGWIGEAIAWTRQVLRDSTPAELLQSKRSNVVIIPYTLVDRVLAAAAEGGEKEDAKVQAAAKELREDVERRLKGLAKVNSHPLLLPFPALSRGLSTTHEPPAPTRPQAFLHLFFTWIPICLLVVTSIGEVRWGGKESWLGSLMAAAECSGLVVSAVMGSISGHHQYMILIKGKDKIAWSNSLLFGLMWTSFGLAHRMIGHDHTSLTPSSAQYESLRPVHRSFGPIGIDLLLSTSAYLIFTIIEVFFPSPSLEDRKLWEWIKMQPIDKDAIAISQSWGSLASTAIAPDRGVELPGTSTDWAAITDHTPTDSSEDDGAYTVRHPNDSDTSDSQNTRITEQTNLSQESEMNSESYGSIRPAHNLIDLESGRMNSNFSFPSNRSGQYRVEVSAAALEPVGSISNSSTESTNTSTDSEATVVASSVSDTSIGTTLLRNLLTSRPSHPRCLKSTVIGIMLLWLLVFGRSLPNHLSLSSPLIEHTPIAVACIIPPVNASLADMVYLSQTVSGRVKLIVWPEDSVVVGSELEKDTAVEEVRLAIGVQYGVWTLMSVRVEETGQVERILVGVDGRLEAGLSVDGVERGEGTDWTVLLPPPTGVTRFNWTQEFPHFRPVHLATTSPSNRLGHSSIPTTEIPPSLLIVPAQSTSEARSALQLIRTQEMAIKHGTPAFLCTSSPTGHGTSAVIDQAGGILFQQSGGQTWSLSLALWFREGEERPWTGYEDYFGEWTFGTLLLVLSIYMFMELIDNDQSSVESSTGITEMGSWSSRIRRSITSAGTMWS